MKLRAATGLRHHVRDAIAPGRVVSGAFVKIGSGRRSVNFDQYEASWIVGHLDDVEAGDARFLNAGASILESGRDERVYAVGFDAHVNMNN